MIGDINRISEEFLYNLLALGLTAEDIQDAIQRKKQHLLSNGGIVDIIPAREAFEVFIQNLEYKNGHGRQYRSTSKKVYQQVIRDFYLYCMAVNPDLQVTEIARYTIAFLTDRSERLKFQAATWNKYAAILRTFINETADHYNVNKGILPRFQSLTQHIPQALPDTEVHQLLKIAKGSNYSLRSTFMVSFFLGTGLRRDEFRRLQLRDIDLSIPAAHIQGKGGTERVVIIPDSLLPILKSYCDAYGINRPYHFVYSKIGNPANGVNNNTIDDAVRRLLSKLPTYSSTDARYRYHLHTLRHTYAVHLLRAKVPLRTIAQVLGHKSVTTTQIYTVLDTEGLREQLMPGLKKLSDWWGW